MRKYTAVELSMILSVPELDVWDSIEPSCPVCCGDVRDIKCVKRPDQQPHPIMHAGPEERLAALEARGVA